MALPEIGSSTRIPDMAYERRAITETEILAVLRTAQQWEFGPDLPADQLIDFESPARDLLYLFEIPGALTFGPYGRWINDTFEISISRATWKQLLGFGSIARGRDVCRVISQHALVPRIADAVVLGRPCRAAGAFWVCRDLLIEGGEHPDRIAPATQAADIRPQAIIRLFRTLTVVAPQLIERFGPLPANRDGWLLWGAGLGLFGALIAILLGLVSGSLTAWSLGVAFGALVAA